MTGETAVELVSGAVPVEDHVPFLGLLENEADALPGAVTVVKMVLETVVVRVDPPLRLNGSPVLDNSSLVLGSGPSWLYEGPYSGGP